MKVYLGWMCSEFHRHKHPEEQLRTDVQGQVLGRRPLVKVKNRPFANRFLKDTTIDTSCSALQSILDGMEYLQENLALSLHRNDLQYRHNHGTSYMQNRCQTRPVI